MERVKLITVTPDAEKTMAYIARVSSPNQENPDYERLLSYCIKNKHWSVFEHAYMTLEIKTTRAISAQIIRHRSFTFSEFSQRYSEPMAVEYPQVRAPHPKNRQASLSFEDEEKRQSIEELMKKHCEDSYKLYQQLIDDGVAKECARMILPLSTATRLYMTGSCRSWIHYIELRTGNGTQLEHQEIAQKCKTIFTNVFPTVSRALNWM